MGIWNVVKKTRRISENVNRYRKNGVQAAGIDGIRLLVKGLAAITGSIFLSVLLIGGAACVVVMAVAGDENRQMRIEESRCGFSEETERYRQMVNDELAGYGLWQYTDCILGLMEVLTGGQTTDPMQAGSFSENTEYPGGIGDPEYSVKIGIEHFLSLADELEITGLSDYGALLIAYQSYLFDQGKEGFTEYATAAGGYTPLVAEDYREDADIPGFFSSAFALAVAGSVKASAGVEISYAYPLAVYEVTSDYSPESPDILFKGISLAPVYAVGDGLIQSVSYDTVCGYILVLDLASGERVTLSGMGEIEAGIQAEAYVTAGQQVGRLLADEPVLRLLMQVNGEGVSPHERFDRTYGSGAAEENPKLHQQLVNRALSFVGVLPYVWGGTSLETGADCSGFVMCLYAELGYTLPRNSAVQAEYQGCVILNGDAITPEALAPGDLLFYRGHRNGTYTNGVGHVAIYIGNGQIVHAASEQSGTCVSNWNYTTPIRAVRIIP